MSRGGATAGRIADIGGVEVEHLVGLASKAPLVKLRILDDKGAPVAVGQLDVGAAREIAHHLLESAARAEYEVDFITTAEAEAMPPNLIGGVLTMIRSGEERRHTGTNP